MHKQPALAADSVVFDKAGRLLLIRRKNPPFQGQYALPGGFVDYGERMEAAALRELREETGIEGRIVRLIGVYSRPDRDPRGHCVSAVYLVDAGDQQPVAGDDAASA
jgi:8-oxo-dGTP diphosphatase